MNKIKFKIFLFIFSALIFILKTSINIQAQERSEISIKEIKQKTLTLTFKGYIEINDKYTFKILPNIPDTINGHCSLQFVKIGDIIFGYEIDSFVKKIVSEKDENGREYQKDKSVLILKNKQNETIHLPLNEKTVIQNKCYIATLTNSEDYLWEGKNIWLGHKKYTVETLTEKKVILTDGTKKITLTKQSSLNQNGSVLYFEFKVKKNKTY